jgi:hypothetical protein
MFVFLTTSPTYLIYHLHWPCWSRFLPPLFCLSRSEITGSPIYRPVNRPLSWVSFWPMQLCGYCSVHPASPRKQPRLWARRPTQHSCLYPNLFVYLYATVRLSLWEIYIVLFCSVLSFCIFRSSSPEYIFFTILTWYGSGCCTCVLYS